MEHNTNRLTLTDRPFGLWFVCGLFIVSGSVMLWKRATIGGGICLAIGLLILVGFGGVSTCDLDSERGTATLKYRSLFRSKTRECPFTEIAAVEVSRSRGSRRSRPSFCVELVTASGERLPLTPYYSSGWNAMHATAERLRAFLGLPSQPGLMQQALQMAFTPTARSSQAGSTDGVNWQLEIFKSTGGGTVTRWFTAAVQSPGQFLMLVQSPGGAQRAATLGNLLGSFAQLAYTQFLRMYQVNSNETPGLESAGPVEGLDPRLAQYYITLTSDSYEARQLLNVWAVQPLVEWAERHPVRSVQVVGRGQLGPLFVLFSPRGLVLAFSTAVENEEQVNAVAQLGVALVRAQGESRAT
jgi:hypothetical protein